MHSRPEDRAPPKSIPKNAPWPSPCRSGDVLRIQFARSCNSLLEATCDSPGVETVVRDSATPGMRDIVLLNRGAVDAEPPPTIALPRGCTIADGVNGYALAHAASG